MITDKHILIDDQLLSQIKKIHDNRNKRSKRHKTQGNTMRMLLRIGINQYTKESGDKHTRELERQQAQAERQQKAEDETEKSKDNNDNTNHLIKMI